MKNGSCDLIEATLVTPATGPVHQAERNTPFASDLYFIVLNDKEFGVTEVIIVRLWHLVAEFVYDA
jgi:hypothetical protein